MSFRGKIIYLGEWIKVRNKPTKYMEAKPCQFCKEMNVGQAWYNLTTRDVRCQSCFDAEKQHWDYWLEYDHRFLQNRRKYAPKD